MSVDAIGSVSNAAQVSPLQARSPSSVQDVPSQDGDGVSVEISAAAKNKQALEDLAQSDPAAFKEKTDEISKKLQALADAGGPGADFAGKLADRFKEASQTSSAEGLAPSHHGHHKHHQAAKTSSNTEGGAPAEEQVRQTYSNNGSRSGGFAEIQSTIEGVLNSAK